MTQSLNGGISIDVQTKHGQTFEEKYDQPQDWTVAMGNLLRDLKKSTRVMLPCEIVFISSDYKTVNLKILDKDIDNAGNIIDYPIVTNCPIKHPAESGQAYIHLPPSIGDQGTVEFFDSSVDEMFVLDNPVYDDNEEWHHLSNGLYTSGFSSKSKSFAVDSNAPITMGLKNNTFTFKVNSSGELTITTSKLKVIGNLEVTGSIKAGNGSTGTYTNSVTATNGIVTGGS